MPAVLDHVITAGRQERLRPLALVITNDRRREARGIQTSACTPAAPESPSSKNKLGGTLSQPVVWARWRGANSGGIQNGQRTRTRHAAEHAFKPADRGGLLKPAWRIACPDSSSNATWPALASSPPPALQARAATSHNVLRDLGSCIQRAQSCRTACAAAASALLGAGAPAQTITANFAGLNLTTTRARVGHGCAPPDPDGAIGNNQFVEFINGGYAVYSRTGALLTPVVSDSTFWANAGMTFSPLDQGVYSTRIKFDPSTQRWFAAELSGTRAGFFGSNLVLLGVSRTANPLDGWTSTSFDVASDTRLNDFPTLSVDANAIDVGTNDYNPDGTAYIGSTISSIPKSSRLNPTPTTNGISTFTQNTATSSMGFTPQVALPVASDHALLHRQHRRDKRGLRGPQQAQRDRQRQHPLPHRSSGAVAMRRLRTAVRGRPASGRVALCAKAARQRLVDALALPPPQAAGAPGQPTRDAAPPAVTSPAWPRTRPVRGRRIS